jgi:hypothetical protein
MSITGLERYFDTSGLYPAEVTPLRSICGSEFDPQHSFTRVEPDHQTGFLVHAGVHSNRWCVEELLRDMDRQLWWWKSCQQVGPWHMQPESSTHDPNHR